MGFSLKQRIRENNILWAIAFSPETFVDEEEQSRTTEAAAAARTEKNGKNKHLERYHCFATCGGRKATIYEYRARTGDDHEKADSTSTTVQPKQSYTSSHNGEDFYAVTFAQRRLRGLDMNDKNGKQQRRSKNVLCVGGARAEILILDVETCSLQATLSGSISYISDLKSIRCGSGAQKYNLLCSATRGEIRIWNLDTLANVCIFAGAPNGHVGDVLSVAWHPTGSRIISGGGEAPDSTSDGNANTFQICVWNVLDSARLSEAIEASSYLPDFANNRSQWNPHFERSTVSIEASSYLRGGFADNPGDFTDADNRSQFNPHIERRAVSVHNDVHFNKVDCVAWVGDLILSKSIFDEIILWQPLIHEDFCRIAGSCAKKNSILPIKVFRYARNDSFFFVRFALSLDDPCLLAVGNNCGQVYLWDVSDSDDRGSSQILKTAFATGKKKAKMSKTNAIMRGLAFSPDGETLVGCSANGDVYRWSNIERSNTSSLVIPVCRIRGN
jgi:polycomb protein EED